MHRQPGHNARSQDRFPPSFLSLDDLTTNVGLICKLDVLGLSFDTLSMGVSIACMHIIDALSPNAIFSFTFEMLASLLCTLLFCTGNNDV